MPLHGIAEQTYSLGGLGCAPSKPTPMQGKVRGMLPPDRREDLAPPHRDRPVDVERHISKQYRPVAAGSPARLKKAACPRCACLGSCLEVRRSINAHLHSGTVRSRSSAFFQQILGPGHTAFLWYLALPTENRIPAASSVCWLESYQVIQGECGLRVGTGQGRDWAMEKRARLSVEND